MDPRVTWYQPEQLGRATYLWTQIFDSATEDLQNFHVGDSMSKSGTGSPSPTARSSASRTAPLDFIPLNGDNTLPASKKKGPNGFIFGDKQDTINRKRKDNLASTYDWNHSGKLRSGGTPWRVPGQRYSGVVGLHHEIIDFYHFMLPRREEHQMRNEVVHRIQGIVKAIWPEAKVEIYGSYRTMLYLPTSDIDLVVFGEIGDCPYFRLGNELDKSGIAEPGTIKILDKASVPIVKFKDNLTKVRVDISFNMRTGTDCAKLIQSFMQQFPSLPLLVFTLKQFLLQRDLNEVWTGGISSYSLILMIVSYLQLHAPPEPENYGVLLIEFFELYGNNFNYFKTGISVVDGGYYFAKEDAQKKMTQGYRTNLLCIEDPLNPGLDICKSSYGFMAVRQAFNYAFKVLCQGVLPHIDQEDEIESILGRIIRVTDEVIAYRHWIHQHWYPNNAHLSIPAMLTMPYLQQMVAINQLQMPENTAIRIDNSSTQRHANNNNEKVNNNNVSARIIPTTVTTPSASSGERGSESVVTPAGQGTPDQRTEVKASAELQLQRSMTANRVVVTIPGSNELEAPSAGTLSSPSSQEDLSSCSDAESEQSSHASVSSKDTADSTPEESPSPPPPPPQGRHKAIATAVVSIKSSSAMTPSIIVSSSTSQRTATPPIIKPSAVLSVSSSSTTTEAVSKPKSASRDGESGATSGVVVASSVVVGPKSEQLTLTTSSPPQAVKLPATATVTSIQQPVVSKVYRNKNHQFHAQPQQSSKYRSTSASTNNNNTTGSGSTSGGKRFKRKHKRDSQTTNR